MVVGVAGAAGVNVAAQIRAKQRKISDTIENLVAGTFIGKQQRIVDRAVRTKHEQIAVGDASSETLVPQGGDVAVEHKRAAAGDVAGKGVAFEQEGPVLWPDWRIGTVVEVIADGQAGACKWSERDRLFGGAD